MTFSENNIHRLSEVHRWAFKEKTEDGSRELDVKAVPVRIAVRLHNFTVSNIWSWKDRFDLESEKDDKEVGSERGFEARPFVKCKGLLENDTISIFEYPKGELINTEELYEVTIRPLSTEKIGGELNHSPASSSAYLGFGSSLEIPKEGLMNGEVGALRAWPEDRDYARGIPDFSIHAELYVSVEIFESLIALLSEVRSEPVNVMADIVAQMFHHEVDAALSEPWHSKDYGLRIYGESRWAYAPARLDILRFDQPVTGSNLHKNLSDKEESEIGVCETTMVPDSLHKYDTVDNSLRKPIRQIRNALVVIILLLVVMLIF